MHSLGQKRRIRQQSFHQNKIAITGRIQSREYRKRDPDGNITVKTAYEVSILKLESMSEE